jgi:hypothetical protein
MKKFSWKAALVTGLVVLVVLYVVNHVTFLKTLVGPSTTSA